MRSDRNYLSFFTNQQLPPVVYSHPVLLHHFWSAEESFAQCFNMCFLNAKCPALFITHIGSCFLIESLMILTLEQKSLFLCWFSLSKLLPNFNSCFVFRFILAAFDMCEVLNFFYSAKSRVVSLFLVIIGILNLILPLEA